MAELSIEELAAQVRRLTDERDIRHVVQMYSRAVDRGDLELLRSVYHDGAVEDREGGTMTAEQWQDRMWEKMRDAEGGTWSHHLGPTNILRLEGEVAEVETPIVALTFRIASDGEPATIRAAGARYIDTLERRDGQWKIVRRHPVNDWIAAGPHVDPGEASGSDPGKRFSREDASYFGR